jgi:hypothetical protein
MTRTSFSILLLALGATARRLEFCAWKVAAGIRPISRRPLQSDFRGTFESGSKGRHALRAWLPYLEFLGDPPIHANKDFA